MMGRYVDRYIHARTSINIYYALYFYSIFYIYIIFNTVPIYNVYIFKVLNFSVEFFTICRLNDLHQVVKKCAEWFTFLLVLIKHFFTKAFFSSIIQCCYSARKQSESGFGSLSKTNQ